MTLDLTLLIWSTGLFGLYVGVQALLYRVQHGVEYAATGRDGEPPPNALTGRGNKALRNLLETYPVFAVLMVANLLLPEPDALATWGAVVYLVARVLYLPLYVSGVQYIRSLVWSVGAAGQIAMFIGVAF
jgi:uncharacterized MAPEG superfamily protein